MTTRPLHFCGRDSYQCNRSAFGCVKQKTNDSVLKRVSPNPAKSEISWQLESVSGSDQSINHPRWEERDATSRRLLCLIVQTVPRG